MKLQRFCLEVPHLLPTLAPAATHHGTRQFAVAVHAELREKGARFTAQRLLRRLEYLKRIKSNILLAADVTFPPTFRRIQSAREVVPLLPLIDGVASCVVEGQCPSSFSIEVR